MKSYLLSFGLLAMICGSALSQPTADAELYERFIKGPDSVEALESVLKAPEVRSALILYGSAGAAFKAKRLEYSGFLFYAAQLRARFDKECFSAKGKGGDSPLVLLAALSKTLGSEINPAIMAEPKAFAKAIERVQAWSPKASKDYNPGYEFTARKTEQDAHEAAKPNRAEFLSRMSDMSALLNDAQYFAAFRVVQAFNLAADDKLPTQEAYDTATERMKRIEKDKGLKGVFTK